MGKPDERKGTWAAAFPKNSLSKLQRWENINLISAVESKANSSPFPIINCVPKHPKRQIPAYHCHLKQHQEMGNLACLQSPALAGRHFLQAAPMVHHERRIPWGSGRHLYPGGYQSWIFAWSNLRSCYGCRNAPARHQAEIKHKEISLQRFAFSCFCPYTCFNNRLLSTHKPL